MAHAERREVPDERVGDEVYVPPVVCARVTPAGDALPT